MGGAWAALGAAANVFSQSSTVGSNMGFNLPTNNLCSIIIGVPSAWRSPSMRIPYWSVGLFLMLCPANLSAENYVAVAEDRNGTIHSIDIDSIVKIQHYRRTNVYEVWEEWDHSGDKTKKREKQLF
jgi:hypothetical protein